MESHAPPQPHAPAQGAPSTQRVEPGVQTQQTSGLNASNVVLGRSFVLPTPPPSDRPASIQLNPHTGQAGSLDLTTLDLFANAPTPRSDSPLAMPPTPDSGEHRQDAPRLPDTGDQQAGPPTLQRQPLASPPTLQELVSYESPIRHRASSPLGDLPSPSANPPTIDWATLALTSPAPAASAPGIQRNLTSGTATPGLTPDQAAQARRTQRLAGRNYLLIPTSSTRFDFRPLQPNGRTLYFFFGFTNSASDQSALEAEAPFIEDDVIHAANQGFRVIYDLECTPADFAQALYNPTCYGIYWSGHGDIEHPGNILMSTRQSVPPEAVNRDQVSPNLRYFILAACYSARAEQRWRAVLPQQCQFEGWVDLTNTAEAEDFTSSAVIGDSWVAHGGLNPDQELRDYVDAAGE